MLPIFSLPCFLSIEFQVTPQLSQDRQELLEIFSFQFFLSIEFQESCD